MAGTRDRTLERLESLESELEWARDLNEVGVRDTQASISDMRADLARLKADLAVYQSQQEKLAQRLEGLNAGLSAIVGGMTKLETKMTAPRKIVRDESGLITKVEIER